MPTNLQPGEDSIYVIADDMDELEAAIDAIQDPDPEVVAVLKREKLQSDYIWLSQTPAKTADGKLIIEIPRNMVRAQTIALQGYMEKVYDKVSIRPLLPKDDLDV